VWPRGPPLGQCDSSSGARAIHRSRAAARALEPNVRFGSEADIASRSRHVRYSPQSGHSSARFARSCHTTLQYFLPAPGRTPPPVALYRRGSKLIAGERCHLAFQIRLLEEAAVLHRFGSAAEGSGDQPPLLVGREHPPRLQTGHERAVFAKEVAPQGPQAILFLDRPDLDTEACGARRNVGGRI
jgi:hypothetical protein